MNVRSRGIIAVLVVGFVASVASSLGTKPTTTAATRPNGAQGTTVRPEPIQGWRIEDKIHWELQPTGQWVAGGAVRDAAGVQVPIVDGPDLGCGGGEPAADGERILYQAAHQLLGQAVDQNAPPDGDVRMVDLITGEDRLVAAHSCGASWSTDGRIAYLDLATGAIHVQAGVDGPVQVWNDPGGNLHPDLWAGPHLLAARCQDAYCSPNTTTVVVLDGPGRVRALDLTAPAGLVDAADRLIAVNPEGTQAVTYLEGVRPSTSTDAPVQVTQVRLVDVTSGSVLDTIETNVANEAPIGGPWQGDTVVARQGASQFRSRPAMGIFLITIRAQHLGRRPGIDLPEEWGGGDFSGARFTDSTQQTVEAWWSSYGRDELFICTMATLRCSIGLVEAHGATFLNRRSRP